MKCNKRIANGFNKLQVLNKSNLISYCGLRWIIWKIRFVRQRILLPTRTVISCRPTLITCISRYEIGIWFSFVKLTTATIGCVQITNLFKSIKRPSSTLSNPIFWRKKMWFLFLSILFVIVSSIQLKNKLQLLDHYFRLWIRRTSCNKPNTHFQN